MKWPFVALFVTALVQLGVVLQAGKMVFSRLLDGVDPALVDEIQSAEA